MQSSKNVNPSFWVLLKDNHFIGMLITHDKKHFYKIYKMIMLSVMELTQPNLIYFLSSLSKLQVLDF